MSLFKSPGWGIQKGLTETPGECGRLAVALLCVSRDGNDNEELTVLTLPDSITPTSLPPRTTTTAAGDSIPDLDLPGL